MCDHTNDPGGREAAMVTIRPGTPEKHGRDGVWCDPCLVDLVRALNDDGLPTTASCCGHGGRPGRIDLADGRVLFIADPETAERINEWLHRHQLATDPEYAADYTQRTKAAEDPTENLLKDIFMDPEARAPGKVLREAAQEMAPSNPEVAAWLLLRADRIESSAGGEL